MLLYRADFLRAAALLASLLLLAPACKKISSAIDPPERIAERAAWRLTQDREMRGALSPLARVDYVHLPPGEHLIKADAPPLRLPAPALAPYQGEVRLRVESKGMSFSAAPPIAWNGVSQSAAALRPRNVLSVGRVQLLITDVDKDPAIAIYDPEAPARRAYNGLHYYPDDADYFTIGRLERYATPRKVRVAATRGEDRELDAVGMLHFTLLGKSAAIEAYTEQLGQPRLFLIFRDATAGQPGQSYGAGRYLYATPKADDRVPLDFNQAWNPLCAYSPFFHCPVPPRTNHLPFPIPVGEKTYHSDH